MTRPSPDPAPPAPPAAATLVFDATLPLAERYGALLAQDATARGLIGPREIPRLWDRHLLNCAVLTELIPHEARVVDVGSGAGLPGVPMAIRRRDLTLDLVEPMLRRTTFLTEVVERLELADRVRIVRGRADEPRVRTTVGAAAWVVARAVAPLDRLVRWCLPLLAPGGSLLALKGASASSEVEVHRRAVQAFGAAKVTIVPVGESMGIEPTWVVVVQRPDGAT